MNKINKKFSIFSIVLIFCLFLFLTSLYLETAEVKSLITNLEKYQRIEVRGSVFIRSGIDGNRLYSIIQLRNEGKLFGGQVVLVNSKNIPEVSKGEYRKMQNGFSPVPGNDINFRINLSNLLLERQKITPITGSARIGTMINLISPRLNERIDLKRIKTITIRWNPAFLRGKLQIFEYTGNKWTGTVYEDRIRGVSSMSFDASDFKPGKKYELLLSNKMGEFTLTGPCTIHSKLILTEVYRSYFYTE